MSRDFMNRAQSALDAERGRWTPQEGEQLSGTLLQMRRMDGNWGDFRIAVIQPFDGSAAMEVSEKTALKEPFDDMERYGAGCQVAIKYTGRKTGKGGSTYEGFTAYIEPSGGPGSAPAPAQPPVPAQPAPQPAAAAPAPQPAPVPQPAPAATEPAPQPAQKVETAQELTEKARAALTDGDKAALEQIGARGRELNYQWDRSTQQYVDLAAGL